MPDARGSRARRSQPGRSSGRRQFRSPSCSFRFSVSREVSRRSSAPRSHPRCARLHGCVQRFPFRRRAANPATEKPKPGSGGRRGGRAAGPPGEEPVALRAGRHPRSPCVHSSLQTSRGAAALLGGTVAVGFVVVAAPGDRRLVVGPAPPDRDRARAAGPLCALARDRCVAGTRVRCSLRAWSSDLSGRRDRPHPGAAARRSAAEKPHDLASVRASAEYGRYSANHTGGGTEDDHRRFLAVWQVGAARELGRAGVIAAVPLTALLAGLAAWFALALRRSLPAADGLPPASSSQTNSSP